MLFRSSINIVHLGGDAGAISDSLSSSSAAAAGGFIVATGGEGVGVLGLEADGIVEEEMEGLFLLELLLLVRFAVRSFHTKQEFPANWVFGLRPRFFLGICSTVSRSELVNAVKDLSRPASLFLSSFCDCCCCVDAAFCEPDELTFQTVGVMKVQSPPFQAASRMMGGLPRRRLIKGSPSSVNRISVDGASGSYFSGLDDFGRTKVRLVVVVVVGVEFEVFAVAAVRSLEEGDAAVTVSEGAVDVAAADIVELVRRSEGTVGA